MRSIRSNKLLRNSPDEGKELFMKIILDDVLVFIPQRLLQKRNSTHLWLNNKILNLIKTNYESINTYIKFAIRKIYNNKIVIFFLKDV